MKTATEVGYETTSKLAVVIMCSVFVIVVVGGSELECCYGRGMHAGVFKCLSHHVTDS